MAVHVASLNTLTATELCIRTMRLYADHPHRLIVGDSGSTDGSVEMLEELAGRGWLTLQRHPGRSHADWLDAWTRTASSRYLVFVDSDIEFRRHGWLSPLLRRARIHSAAIVALDIHPVTENSREPVSGRLVRGMPAPTTWLFMLDAHRLGGCRESFAFKSVETDAVPEGCIVYDTGAVVLEAALRRGCRAVAMPASYRRTIKHYGSMTWFPDVGEPGRRRRRNLAVIDRRLRAVRSLQNGRNPLRRAISRALLKNTPEDALEFAARAYWHLDRMMRRASA